MDLEDNCTEYRECRLFWQWAQLHPILRENLIHIVNEGRRSVQAGKRLQMIGLRKGVPDYVLPVKSGEHGALWIEMKRKRGGVVSPEQDAWINRLNAGGHLACVCYGFDEAREITEQYLRNMG
jgi:hypothetical protein